MTNGHRIGDTPGKGTAGRAVERFAALFLVLLGGSVAASSARAAQSPGRPSFEGQAPVLSVEVPVHVHGADGRPVRGLAASDFELFDEGERQEIRDLEVVDLEPADAAPGVDAAPPEPLAASARRHLLLLFDVSFAQPATLARARAAAREFVLGSLHPTDLAAVVVYSLETGPRLVVTFTPDRAQLARAIDELSAQREYRAFDRDPLRFLLGAPLEQPAESLTSGFTPGGGVAQDESLDNLTTMRKQMEVSEKAYERGRISAWSRGLSDLARWLRTVQGRKQVLLFSEGIDTRLMLGREPDNQDPEFVTDQLNLQSGNLWLVDSDDLFGNVGVQRDMARLVEEFRRADCVLQTVDVRGLQAQGETTRRPSASGRESLFYLANETGGGLFENDNDLRRGLDQILGRSSVTYLLSFQPSRVAWDGSYHRLKVALKKGVSPGAALTYRSGYYAPREFKELDPQEKALLASEAIAAAMPRDEIEMDVLAAPFRAAPGAAYVPVIVEVEGRSLLDGHAGSQLGAEIYAYVTNERGEMKDFFSRIVGLDLAAGREALAAGGLKYYGHLDLGPGRYLIRVLVRNAETGRTGVAAVPLVVPELERAAALLPPFFLDSPGRWLLVREAPEQGDGEMVVYPFTANGEPYVPAARPLLRAGESARVCLVAYNLAAAGVELESSVVDAAGRPAAGGELLGLERTVTGISGLDRFVADFEPARLDVGDYELRVALIDRATGARADARAPFSVVE